MSIKALNSKTEYESFIKSNDHCAVHFTLDKSDDETTQEVISKLAKILTTVADKYPSITFATVDLQSNDEIAQDQNIAALSTFKFYKKESLLFKFATYGAEAIEEHCESFINSTPLPVLSVMNKTDFEEVLKTNEYAVVDFTAMWCGPCRYIGPQFEKLAREQAEKKKNLLDGEQLVTFVKVDADEARDVIESAKVNCYPTFKLYKNGEECDKLEGADIDSLSLKIKKMLDPEYKEVHHAEFIEDKETFDKLVKDTEIVVVDFTASWCPPCKRIKPIFEGMAKDQLDNDRIKFIKIDVDENAETAEAAKVESMPTFHIYVKGEKKHEWSGADEKKLKEKVEEVLKD